MIHPSIRPFKIFERSSCCRSLVILLTAFLTFASCSNTKELTDVPYAESDDCVDGIKMYTKRSYSPDEEFSDVKDAGNLEDKYSSSSLRVGHAIGVMPYLIELDELEEISSDDLTQEYRLRKMELRETIHHRIQLTSLEITSMVAALHCEQNRAFQVSTFLQQRIRERERKINVLSITIPAVATVVDGVFLAISPGLIAIDVLTIGAGLTSAILAFSNLRVERTTQFKHERNVLKEVWLGADDPDYIPSSIWYYLTRKEFSAHDERNVREQLVQRWVELQEIEEENEDEDEDEVDGKTGLLFGDGGVYSHEYLEIWSTMHEHLAVEVNLMQKDLLELVTELN